MTVALFGAALRILDPGTHGLDLRSDADSAAVTSSQLPTKARARRFWQRIVLTIRYAFRLPIDQIKQQQVDGIADIQSEFATNLNTQAEIIQLLHARLAWYEAHIPAIAKQRRAFLTYQQKLEKKKTAKEPPTG